jgi:hypothetical protein
MLLGPSGLLGWSAVGAARGVIDTGVACPAGGRVARSMVAGGADDRRLQANRAAEDNRVSPMYRVLISTSKTSDLLYHEFLHNRLASYARPFDIEGVAMGLPVCVALGVGSSSV